MKVNRRKELFPNVTDEQWNDWKWQVKNRIETYEQLSQYFTFAPEEAEGIKKALAKFRMAITPYYLSLIDPNDPYDPIRRQAIPAGEECNIAPADLNDPLHEDEDSPAPGLTHRYPDRVLFLITDMCSMYCRHCTRRRFAGQKDDESPSERIEKCLAYIEKTPQVRDVLLSGGDCLMVSDQKLEYIIGRLRKIPHVEIVRLGSRTPVVCPQRITPELCEMLKKYHPIWLNTHFNHPNEFTPEAEQALARLANAGIPLGNQTVLLRGVNDCVHVMKKLMHELVRNRVRPYYIYQCDLSMGLEHFRTPVVCPQRITPELCEMLKKYHPIWLNTHFNHPNEFTPEAEQALARLANAGIPLGNQTVLLRGVNDCVHVMKKLMHELVRNRVRPYYIYQCDLSMGLEHFRTPVSKGIEIIENLRGHTSGYAVPTFVVDAPGGGGKTPVMPQYVISQSPDKVILRNFEGVITTYTEPREYHEECHCEACQAKRRVDEGVASLLETDRMALEPSHLMRHERNKKK